LRFTATGCHDGKLEIFINSLAFFWKGKSKSTIVAIGIDFAKNVFAVHVVGATGKPALVRSSVPRAKLLSGHRVPHLAGVA
jgi:hypothetical protein